VGKGDPFAEQSFAIILDCIDRIPEGRNDNINKVVNRQDWLKDMLIFFE
jgi:predicted dithiol-disulfide oxidoreductase (DUF899 family)